MVADAVINHTNPIRLEIRRLLNSPDYLLSVLKTGAEQAEPIAQNTACEVRARLGLSYRKHIDIKTHEELE